MVNQLDSCVHVTDYDTYLELITELEEYIEGYKNRIERSLFDEELLFSYQLAGTYENWKNAHAKIQKLSLFWHKASVFYEHKKNFLLNFTLDINLDYSIDMLSDIEVAIKGNKKGIKKNEEVLVRITKILEEDINFFKDFLILCKTLMDSVYLEEHLKSKLLDIEDNKKLDPGCKQTLKIICSYKNFSLG